MRQLADAAMAFAYADGAIAPALSVLHAAPSANSMHSTGVCLCVCACMMKVSVCHEVCVTEREIVCVYVHVLCMCVCACGSVRGSVSVRESV